MTKTTTHPTATESTGNRRYSPTKVRRRLDDDTLVAEYPDATVRDSGESGRLRLPTAMLRAYSNDLAANDPHGENFVCVGDLVEHYGKGLEGYVLDCDGDVALERIQGFVLSKDSFGHGVEWWQVLVSQDDEGEWNGWGDGSNLRIERWEVAISSAEDVAASRERAES